MATPANQGFAPGSIYPLYCRLRGGAKPSLLATTCPLGTLLDGFRLAAGFFAALTVLPPLSVALRFLLPAGLPEALTFLGPLKLPASGLIIRRSNCQRR